MFLYDGELIGTRRLGRLLQRERPPIKRARVWIILMYRYARLLPERNRFEFGVRVGDESRTTDDLNRTDSPNHADNLETLAVRTGRLAERSIFRKSFFHRAPSSAKRIQNTIWYNHFETNVSVGAY